MVQKLQNQNRQKNILSFDDDLEGPGSSQPGNKNHYPTNRNQSSL